MRVRRKGWRGAGFLAPKPTPSPISSGLDPASPLRPSSMLPLLRCSLGFLLALLPCSLPCQWVRLSASVLGRCHKLSAFWLDIGVWWRVGVCTEEASPTSASPPHAWHIQQCLLPPAVPIMPTSGELAAGLSAAQGGDLHVSTNIYAHPGPSAPAFLGWPFTPGPETGLCSGWICMRVYFWVGSQLGVSERKLLREAGGS